MPVLLLGYFCARERSSGRRRGLRDCSRVRVTSTARYVGLMAPDERRAAKEAGRQLQLRPATWQKRVSVDNAVSRIGCVASAYPETSGRFPAKPKLLGCLRPSRLGDAAIGENGAFDPLQFGNVPIEVQQAIFGPAHLGLALSKSGGLLRQPGLVLISIRPRQNRRRCSRLLKALAESGFFALGSRQSFANRAFDGC